MPGPSDCDEMNAYDINTSGAYFIYPDSGFGPVPMHVWCDMDTDGGGWTVSTPSAVDVHCYHSYI